MTKRKAPPLRIEFTKEGECFAYTGGLRIAKRGKPGTAHAKTWIPLAPGYIVRDVGYPPGQIEVEHKGVRVH